MYVCILKHLEHKDKKMQTAVIRYSLEVWVT